MTQLHPLGTRLVIIPDPEPEEQGGILIPKSFTMRCGYCKGKCLTWSKMFRVWVECARCNGSGTFQCKAPITRKNFRATVVAVGPGKWSKKKGTVRPVPVKPGDAVWVCFWAGRTSSGSRIFDRERYGLPEGAMVLDLTEIVAVSPGGPMHRESSENPS